MDVDPGAILMVSASVAETRALQTSNNLCEAISNKLHAQGLSDISVEHKRGIDDAIFITRGQTALFSYTLRGSESPEKTAENIERILNERVWNSRQQNLANDIKDSTVPPAVSSAVEKVRSVGILETASASLTDDRPAAQHLAEARNAASWQLAENPASMLTDDEINKVVAAALGPELAANYYRAAAQAVLSSNPAAIFENAATIVTRLSDEDAVFLFREAARSPSGAQAAIQYAAAFSLKPYSQEIIDAANTTLAALPTNSYSKIPDEKIKVYTAAGDTPHTGRWLDLTNTNLANRLDESS